jgi:hypothetical protein
MLTAPRQAALLEALVADGPDEERAEALMLFGRFVGEWELDWTGYYEDGSRTERGEWIFAWVLEGRAVQDVWIIPERERRGSAGSEKGEYGTTIRVYDSALDAWLVTWNGPVRSARRTFLARRSGDEIVLDGGTDDERPLRWIFSEITDHSFSWRGEVSPDGGETWELCEEMKVRRKAA